MIAMVLAPCVITVHADRVIRADADQFFGIDLNYIRDRDSNRPDARPLEVALREMGVRWLRFPGGEKSNYHLWSEPPYEKPAPQSLGWYAIPKGDRMNFDQYIDLCRRVKVEPYVVVGYESEERTGLTEQKWLDTATAWVRYAKSKGDRVRYWEVGNENWNGHKGTPTEMARIVCEFATAMKKVDPSILIGASGDNEAWWKDFLPIAAPSIDFLTVSEYTGWEWKSYDRFLNNPELGGIAKTAVAAIDKYAPPSDRPRLQVIVAETNTIDYSKEPWPDSNDLGHALVTFDTLGHLLAEPRIRAAMVWTTRWMDDADAPKSQYYALGSRNELMPTGQALRIWGAFVEPLLVAVEGSNMTTEGFAARSKNGRSMTVWLMNRGKTPQDVRLSVEGAEYLVAQRRQFSGSSENDGSPRWEILSDTALSDGVYADSLAPLSVTILTLQSR